MLALDESSVTDRLDQLVERLAERDALGRPGLHRQDHHLVSVEPVGFDRQPGPVSGHGEHFAY